MHRAHHNVPVAVAHGWLCVRNHSLRLPAISSSDWQHQLLLPHADAIAAGGAAGVAARWGHAHLPYPADHQL